MQPVAVSRFPPPAAVAGILSPDALISFVDLPGWTHALRQYSRKGTAGGQHRYQGDGIETPAFATLYLMDRVERQGAAPHPRRHQAQLGCPLLPSVWAGERASVCPKRLPCFQIAASTIQTGSRLACERAAASNSFRGHKVSCRTNGRLHLPVVAQVPQRCIDRSFMHRYRLELVAESGLVVVLEAPGTYLQELRQLLRSCLTLRPRTSVYRATATEMKSTLATASCNPGVARCTPSWLF